MPSGMAPLGSCWLERVQERGAGHLGLEVAHPHVVLQVIAGLRIGGQAVDVPVIEDLARQPVVDEIVEAPGRGSRSCRQPLPWAM